MRFLFVVNPRAGRGRAPALRRRISRELRGHTIEFTDEAPDRAALEAASPAPTVVAVGGDGTVQRILARAGAPFPCPLGVIPLGSANDLARAAGIPRDLAGACATLRRGATTRIDLLEVNRVPFVTAGGVGLPASIADRADRLRASRVTGILARAGRRCVYLVAALLELVGPRRPVFARVDRGTAAWGRSWSLVVVSNLPLLGGFRPSPAADARDGRLDLCAVAAPRSRRRLARLVWRIRRGRIAGCREARTERARSLIVRTARPAAFLGDGEVLCRGTRFAIRVRPAALRLVVPRAATRSRPRRPAGAIVAPDSRPGARTPTARRNVMKTHGRPPGRSVLTILIALALLAGAGCGDDGLLGPSDAPLDATRFGAPAGPDGTDPPAGTVTVSLAGESLVLWPYTGEGFDGTPKDPVNVIFAGDVHPLEIRAALMSLDGDRSALGLPPVPPFDARWTDIVGGGVQTTYTEGPLGWTGSVVQLTLGDFGPLRVHLRLFTTGLGHGESGSWTVGAAHFELQIPGTADHQVLDWEIAEAIVVADLARSGLLDTALPMMPTGTINDSPFRTIPAVIYNGLPPAVIALIEGPPPPVTEDVPIRNDGSAMILHVAGRVPREAGAWNRAATAVYDQIVPKPFCTSGPGEFLHVSGPVDFVTDVTVDGTGKYVFHARYWGHLYATPVNLVRGEPVAVGAPLRVRVRGEQNGFLDDENGRITAHDRRMVRGGGGPETWVSRLVAPERGRKSWTVREKCLDDDE